MEAQQFTTSGSHVTLDPKDLFQEILKKYATADKNGGIGLSVARSEMLHWASEYPLEALGTPEVCEFLKVCAEWLPVAEGRVPPASEGSKTAAPMTLARFLDAEATFIRLGNKLLAVVWS